jgi:hypothetical protein
MPVLDGLSWVGVAVALGLHLALIRGKINPWRKTYVLLTLTAFCLLFPANFARGAHAANGISFAYLALTLAVAWQARKIARRPALVPVPATGRAVLSGSGLALAGPDSISQPVRPTATT